LATVLCVAIPVGIFLGAIYGLYYYLVQNFDRFHLWLLGGTAAVFAIAMAGALSGIGMAFCLILLMLAPVLTVIGYEIRGHLHQAAILIKKE
jgi:hypothetical protein